MIVERMFEVNVVIAGVEKNLLPWIASPSYTRFDPSKDPIARIMFAERFRVIPVFSPSSASS